MLDRFLAALGVADLDMAPAPEANRSLGAASAELLLKVNAELSHLPPRERPASVKMVLAKQVLAPLATTEPRYALSPEQHKVVRVRAAELADGVRASGVRVIGDMDDVIPGETPSAGLKPDEVGDAEILSAAVHGLAGMCRELTQDRNELRRARKD